MFKKGSLVIYATYGICMIDDICEKTYYGVTRKYYELHPMDQSKLNLSVPVDGKVVMLDLLNKAEAMEIFESFKKPGADWIEADGIRNKVYSEMVKGGKRKEISSVVNTLMRKKVELDKISKRFLENDRKLLGSVQNILFAELAFSLETTSEEILEKVTGFISLN